MSKSKGNFLTVVQACDLFTADGTRLACADAGDTLEDANFSREVANQAILRLYVFEQWAREALEKTARSGPRSFLDEAFANEMSRLVAVAKAGYESMTFRDALRAAWFEFQNLRDEYRTLTDGDMHQGLVRRFLEVQAVILSPICPHFCEHLWSTVLGKDHLVVRATWPTMEPVDAMLSRKYQVLQSALRQFRLDRDKALGKKKDQPKPTHAVVYVAKEYQKWQQDILRHLQQTLEIDEENAPVDPAFMKGFKDTPCIKDMGKDAKKGMQFGSFVIANEVKAKGKEALQLTLPFDELDVLAGLKPTILKQLDLQGLELQPAAQAHANDSTDKRLAATPGKPVIHFWVA